MIKRILLPLQPGDKVVRCPKCTTMNGRGDVGKVTNVVDNLTVQVMWEEQFSSIGPHSTPVGHFGTYPQTERAYIVCKESRCHQCVHRMRHLAGQACPTSWKEVKTIHESVPEQPVRPIVVVDGPQSLSEETSNLQPEG